MGGEVAGSVIVCDCRSMGIIFNTYRSETTHTLDRLARSTHSAVSRSPPKASSEIQFRSSSRRRGMSAADGYVREMIDVSCVRTKITWSVGTSDGDSASRSSLCGRNREVHDISRERPRTHGSRVKIPTNVARSVDLSFSAAAASYIFVV